MGHDVETTNKSHTRCAGLSAFLGVPDMNDTRPVGAESPRPLRWTLLRTALLGGLAVAVLFGGASWLVGQQLAPRLRVALEQAADRAGLRVDDWRLVRGIRGSELQARLVAAGCDRHCSGAMLAGHVNHGPLWATGDHLTAGLAGFDGRLSFDPSPGGPVLAELPPARLAASINLLGRGEGSAVMPAFASDIRRAGEPNATGRLIGARSRATLAFDVASMRRARWTLDVPRLARQDAVAGRLSVRDLSARGATGDTAGRLNAAQVVIDNGQGQATRVRDLAASFTELAPARYQLTLDAGAVLLPDNQTARLAARASGNRQGLTAIFKSAAGWRARGGLAGGALNRSGFYAETIAPGLADARLDVEASLVGEDDEQVDARLVLRGPPDLGGPINAVDVLSALNAQARVGLTTGWLRRLAARLGPPTATERELDQRLETLAERALIQRDASGHVTSRARLADGRLFINGRPRPEWRSVVEQLQAAAPGL